MLDNTITIPSVAAADAAARNVVFTRVREELDKTTYNGPTHAPDKRELLQFYRTAPKQNGASRGMCKSAIKLTRDVSVATVTGETHTMPLIIEVSGSVPVGIAVAELQQALIDMLYGLFEEGDTATGILDAGSKLQRLFYMQEI